VTKQSDYDFLKSIEQRKQALKAELERLDQQARARTKKIEDRKKIIVGSVVLAEAKKNPEFLETLALILDQRLTNYNDRYLFRDYLEHVNGSEPENLGDEHQEELNQDDQEGEQQEEAPTPPKKQRSRKSKSQSQGEIIEGEEVHQEEPETEYSL
jgi:hypothetical protein